MKKLYGALLASAVAVCAFTVQANADTVTIVSQNDADFSVSNPLPPDVPQVLLVGVTGSDVVYNNITGSNPGIDRSPFENLATPGSGYGTWASNRYDAVQGGSSGYVNVLTADTMTMLWGSPDTYNGISFCTGSDGTGSCTLGAYVAGVLPITYGHDLITFDTDFTFASILFTTSQNSLEFADLTTGLNTSLLSPLPGTLPLFAGGLGLIGLLGARKKRKITAVAA